MVSKGRSIDLGQQMISLHKDIFEGSKKVPTLLCAWAKLWIFWKGDIFQKKIDLPIIQYFLAQDQLQGRHQGWSFNTPTCDFGINHVKEERDDVIATSFHNSTALSLLRSLDPY